MTPNYIIKPQTKKIVLTAFYTMLFVLFSQTSTSQTLAALKISDSLKNKSYKELRKGYLSNKNNIRRELIYAKLYLAKAQLNNDTIKMANGYSQLASSYGKIDINISLKYADSIISLTKDINNEEYPGFGYMIKGMCLNAIGNYKTALNNYLKAYDYALKNKNQKQIFYIKNEIGQLKLFWGNKEEALAIFKSQLSNLNENPKLLTTINNGIFEVYFNLSNAYILNNKLDCALYYSQKGLTKSLKNNDTFNYYNFLSQTGEILYYKNELKQAHDSIIKAFPHETNLNAKFNNHYILGNIFKKQQNETKAFYHFSKADSIYNLTNDIAPEIRSLHEYFINYYKEKKDITNQLKYINKLIYVDSVLQNNHLILNETIHKKYDTPILLAEKQQIITTLNKQQKLNTYVIWALLTLTFLGVILIIRGYIKQRNYKKRFKTIVQERNVLSEKNYAIEENTTISDHINDAILEALAEFEKSNGFLRNDITLNSLAQQLNTNSNYLSKTINYQKKKNFSTYISDLRIEYCIDKIKKDATFRKYSIKGISEEIGFNNSESFSKAFYKSTGIYPSYFIKEIDKE